MKNESLDPKYLNPNVKLIYSIEEIEKILKDLNRLYDTYEQDKDFTSCYPNLSEWMNKLVETNLFK